MLILSTTRSIISPLQFNDFDAIIQMYQEPDSNKFIPPLANKTTAEYRSFLEKKLKTNNQPEGLGLWTVRTKDTQDFIGTTNLNLLKQLDLPHLGIHLKRAYWGKGYASEIMATMRDYGFNQLTLPTLHGIVSPEHLASKKMLSKIGLSYQKTHSLFGDEIEIYAMQNPNQ